MAAAVSKLMRNQDLILVAPSAASSPAFATPWACPGGWPCACSPTTRPTTPGIAASMLDGLLYGVAMRSSASTRPPTACPPSPG
jgi:ethanolamine ammonia-lyase large subunit